MKKEYKIRTKKHEGITVSRSIALDIVPEFYSYVFNEYDGLYISYRGKYVGLPPIQDGGHLYTYYFYFLQHNIMFSTERLIRRKYKI